MTIYNLCMNEFEDRVYGIARLIPKGKVASYGQLAEMAGYPRMARAAGRAMRNGPSDEDIPYHRVVNKSGDLAPSHVFGGKERQRRILESEGIVFRPNGRIDMKKCIWKPD